MSRRCAHCAECGLYNNISGAKCQQYCTISPITSNCLSDLFKLKETYDSDGDIINITDYEENWNEIFVDYKKYPELKQHKKHYH